MLGFAIVTKSMIKAMINYGDYYIINYGDDYMINYGDDYCQNL